MPIQYIVLDMRALFSVLIPKFFVARLKILKESRLKNRNLLVLVLLFSLCVAGCGPSLQKSHVIQTNPVHKTESVPEIMTNPTIAESLEAEADSENQTVIGNLETPPMITDSTSCDIPNAHNSPIPQVKVQPLLDEALDFCSAAQEFWQKGELESAIEALDQAYSLIIDVDDSKESPTVIQQKEDIRFMISKRILEIYASRNIIINGNHNEIPLVLNKHVQTEIDRFTKGNEKKFFLNAYIRSGRYRDHIVKELKAAGLPEELSWLPLIESGYKENALSKARALGLWQFIPTTGYKFGLTRNKYIDERLDPEKSTAAAITYLKELHQMFGGLVDGFSRL